jgi:excisionase family DNA binding protein
VAEKEFLSFDEALRELRLKEEELKRLVSEGEIRAFRDGETMKLRKTDVETLRAELQGGEVVDLGSAATEELVFEDDTDVDAGMATEEISESDTILEEDVPEVAEVELEEDEAETVSSGAGRSSAGYADEPYEGGMMRTVLMLTSFVLLLGTPVALASAHGHLNRVAAGLAEMFGAKP